MNRLALLLLLASTATPAHATDWLIWMERTRMCLPAASVAKAYGLPYIESPDALTAQYRSKGLRPMQSQDPDGNVLVDAGDGTRATLFFSSLEACEAYKLFSSRSK